MADPRKEVRKAFKSALDTGSDMRGTTPEDNLRNEWETYIEEQVNLTMWSEDRLPEDPDKFIEEMKDIAPTVAKDMDSIPEYLEVYLENNTE